MREGAMKKDGSGAVTDVGQNPAESSTLKAMWEGGSGNKWSALPKSNFSQIYQDIGHWWSL